MRALRRPLVAAPIVVAALTLGALASCGARSELPLDEIETDASGDLGVLPEGSVRPDGPVEPDRRLGDAIDDLPLIDTKREDVVILANCPDAAATLIYVIGSSDTLYSFNPGTGSFTSIGVIACPGVGAGESPFSMAVNQEGVAYVAFSVAVGTSQEQQITGLYRVSTRTAECTATSFSPASEDGDTFGMGFVANVVDGGGSGPGADTLYIARDIAGFSGNDELATIDTTTFHVTNVGLFSSTLAAVELTGTGDGRLFAFSPSEYPGGSFIAQIDPVNAKVIARDPLPTISRGSAWAFGFWGSAFYLFTAPSDGSGGYSDTVVNRFDPATGLAPEVATIADRIVGAGVSTCAPVN